jgi:hypothetical protein
MQKNILSRQRPHEHGQTIILVAISLVSLLAMAALAIDVVTLYVARTEVQRAADAAALAAAKAIADSGVTTLQISPPDPNLVAARSLAQTMATSAVSGLLSAPAINLVSGKTPTLNTITPIPIDWTRQGNPHVTISLKVSSLPTFFSKLWGGTAASVTATATAEAYNPANLPTTTPITPIALKSVKPWLVANTDPTLGISPGPKIVDTGTWAVRSSLIGKSFSLVSDCVGSTTPCTLSDNPPQIPVNSNATGPQVDYVPALVTPNTANVCPASVGSCNSSCAGASNYELSVECADANVYSYPNCGSGGTDATWNNSVNPGGAAGASATGAQCLIHATGAGPGPQQDTLNPTLWPGAPMQITGGTCSLANAQLVTASSSIVTIPIIDTNTGIPLPVSGQPLIVVGYLQAFINQIDPGPGAFGVPPAGSINITVLNIAGCNPNNNGANPVIGGSGTSPVPVRLITPP